ncbi:hypothetical protein OO013_05720 [Mangrovivirga sp. M17]|uniref:DUF4178 domain-containing protein n=1 Tax=Mangrovivirga halotolerans TaxID=2993936 RepID=A0ABT3RPT6_9BACT|nr:hypothetical protein [Mangrovivirga halotolerans]MCX2743353.1 hypothetical protein [Mangrovivirga halotolerans]
MNTSPSVQPHQKIKFFTQTNGDESEGSGGFQIFFLLVGIGALFFFFSMADSIEDIKEYGWQLLIIFGMLFSIVYSMFKKKKPSTNTNIYFKEEGISIADIGVIPFEDLRLDRYYTDGSFCRYHLYDTNGQIAFYSVLEDDLARTLVSERKIKVQDRKERSVKLKDTTVYYGFDEKATLIYDLDTGEYSFTGIDKEAKSVKPSLYAIDPKYKEEEVSVPLDPINS